MSYTVHFKPSAEREFRNLPTLLHERISVELLTLEQNPRPQGSQKLRARAGYRIRIGDYRVIYSVDDSSRTVYILAIGHRGDIYR